MICAYGGYQYGFLCGNQYGLRQESNFTKQNLLTATGTDNNNKTDLPLSKEEEDKIKWEEGRQRSKANRMMFYESAKRRNSYLTGNTTRTVLLPPIYTCCEQDARLTESKPRLK
jgi:hypothetical protein